VECGVWSVECGVWSVECGVWNVECGMWNVECGDAEMTRTIEKTTNETFFGPANQLTTNPPPLKTPL
jgi:hypothetical protein